MTPMRSRPYATDARLPGRAPNRLLAALAITAIALSACASTAGAGWTYAPTPPSTPAPSVAASAAASGNPEAGSSASPGTSAGPESSGGQASSPAASGGGSGPTLAISAQNIAYDKQSLQAPANTPFTIAFNNQDSGVPHNVSIHKDSPTGQEVFKGDIVTGPTQVTYSVPALPAGTYGFVCSVHPNMTGTLTVQ